MIIIQLRNGHIYNTNNFTCTVSYYFIYCFGKFFPHEHNTNNFTSAFVYYFGKFFSHEQLQTFVQ